VSEAVAVGETVGVEVGVMDGSSVLTTVAVTVAVGVIFSADVSLSLPLHAARIITRTHKDKVRTMAKLRQDEF
jgi:hypothetical protein